MTTRTPVGTAKSAWWNGKSVVLTGASQGIGKAIALALAARGARLSLAARDERALDDVAVRCRELGAREVITVPTDVAEEADNARLVARTLEAFGELDVLLLNAGITMWTRFEEIEDFSIFERLMRVNYLSCVWATRYALAHLRRSRGQIGVVASVAGLTGVPTRTGYSASKHAVIGFFDSLRVELRGSGVAITIVAPDFVTSEIHRRALGPDGKALGKSPLEGRNIMTAEQCALETVQALERRRRLAILSRRGRVGRWVRLAAPGLIDRVAERALRVT